jgi:predicted acylesterase/phospholipase RssA
MNSRTRSRENTLENTLENKDNDKNKYKNDISESFDIDTYVKRSIDQVLCKDEPQVLDTLVLSGGSMKGMAELGALHYMESIGILKNITTLAGSSVGSVICTLICIGYRPVEVYHFFMNVNVKNFTKINAYNFFNKLGLDDGKRFVLVIKKFFKAKSIDPNITFKKLYQKTKKKLIVTGACINDKKTYYFSHVTEPDMRVVDALRISISIPIVYTPRKFKGKIFIDGGCTDNYPIALFKYKIDQVIGIYVSEKKSVEKKISSIETFMMSTMDCIKEGFDMNSFRGYEKHTILIKCKSGEDNHHISNMFDLGYREAIKFFKRLGVKDE